MNDTTLRDVKIVVERAVRPLRVTIARKCRMREELLSHLLAIFEEEAAKGDGDAAAVDRARRRFGDPTELSGQLQASVSRWERFRARAEGLDIRPGQPILRPALRLFLLMLAGYAVAAAAAVPVMIARGRANEIPTSLRIVLVVGVVTAAFSALMMVLVDRVRRALYGRESQRSLRSAALWVLASVGFFPGLAFSVWGALMGDLATGLAHLPLAAPFAPVAPVVFVLMARAWAAKWNEHEAWERLPLDA